MVEIFKYFFLVIFTECLLMIDIEELRCLHNTNVFNLSNGATSYSNICKVPLRKVVSCFSSIANRVFPILY